MSKATMHDQINGQKPLDDIDASHEESATSGQFRFSALAGVTPDVSTFALSGSLATNKDEFPVGAELVISLITDGGEMLASEVIASETVRVVAVGAAQKTDKDGFVVRTERTHRLKVNG